MLWAFLCPAVCVPQMQNQDFLDGVINLQLENGNEAGRG